MKLTLVLFCLTILVLRTCQSNHIKNHVSRGPYKSNIIKIDKCKKTSRPKLDKPIADVRLKLHTSSKENYVTGNFSIFQDVKNFQVNSSGYSWKKDKWELVYSMPTLSCHTPLVEAVSKIMFGKSIIDGGRCLMLKGTYRMSEKGSNIVDHMWRGTELEYGKELWKIEVNTKYNTHFCILAEVSIDPA